MRYAVHARRCGSATMRIVSCATEAAKEMHDLERGGWEIVSAYCCEGGAWPL